MLENEKLKAVPTDGITLEQIAECLDDWRTDRQGRLENGLLCRSANINKWAKNKPIRFAKWTALTDAERKGSAIDTEDGYYWGVQISAGTTAWERMHSVSYEYRRPEGGELSPFRTSDFDGYDHNAVPTVYGYVTGAYYDIENALSVQLDMDTTGWNTTGIDIAAAVWNASTEDSKEKTLGRLYPCVMITDPLGNHYAHALYDDEAFRMLPLFSDNSGTQGAQAKWRRAWHCDMRSMPSGFVKEERGEYTVTVFLVANALGVLGGNGLDTWQRIRPDQMHTDPAFSLPMATGVMLILTDSGYGTYTARFTNGPQVTAQASGFRVAIGIDPMPSEAAPAVVILTVDTYSTTIEFMTSGGFTTVRWSDLGMLPVPGQTYALHAQLSCDGHVAQQTYMVTAI